MVARLLRGAVSVRDSLHILWGHTLEHVWGNRVLGGGGLGFFYGLLRLEDLHRVYLLLLDEAVSLLAGDDTLGDNRDQCLHEFFLVDTLNTYERLQNHKSVASLFNAFELNLGGKLGANEGAAEDIFLRQRSH